MDRWTQALGTRPRVAFEPFGHEAIRAANRAAFGRDAVPYYAFEDAQVILNFGADWVETWINNVALPSSFARMHAFREGRSGAYLHVEPRQSLTAANADQWVRNAPGTELMIVAAILKLIVEEGRGAARAVATAVAQVDPKKGAAESGLSYDPLVGLASALAHGKPSLVIAGGAAASGPDATWCSMPSRSSTRRSATWARPYASARTGHTARPRRTPRSRSWCRRWRWARSRCCCSDPASTRRSRSRAASRPRMPSRTFRSSCRSPTSPTRRRRSPT